MNIEQIIRTGACTIIDVRTPGEFRGGHAAGSINIPLQELSTRLEEIKALRTPLVLCCASGGRSGQATYWLSQQGLDCMNAGSWLDVHPLTAGNPG